MTKHHAWYFTDARYIEAAGRHVQGAEIRQTGPGRGYAVLLEEVLRQHAVSRLGFEDAV